MTGPRFSLATLDALRRRWLRLRRRHFSDGRLRRTIGGMGKGAEITKEALADMAGRVFLPSGEDSVPLKLWVEHCPALGQSYLRACFDGDASIDSIVRLVELADRLDERYGTRLVCCAYGEDMDWAEIEARSRALQTLQ